MWTYFPICQGTLSWQPNNVKMLSTLSYQPLTFVALVLENELQYHGLAVRINSANDACISCENFVKFGPVTPDLTGVVCERQV